MQFFSTNDRSLRRSFREAVIDGLASDKGLFFPVDIPQLPAHFWNVLQDMSDVEIASEILLAFTGEEIDESTVRSIASEALTFSTPVVQVEANIYCLELFHGPTLAFKDVGARFMGRLLPHCADEKKNTVVLVATSGDTGAAVAHGFYEQEGVEVVVLYPKGKVSERQERQMACLGGNVHTLAIDGVFDDCQALVKQAFLDQSLEGRIQLTSANSINIARWLPQAIYYFLAYKQWHSPLTFCVPSGNYGNITAGMVAQRMGLPVHRWIAASNANDVVPEFLKGNAYTPRASVQTLANAMDVGDPSNFVRLLELFDGDTSRLQSSVAGFSATDEMIRSAIAQVWSETAYLLDPHGATGYLALKSRLAPGESGVFLGTAHPAKFASVYDELDIKIEVPEALSRYDNTPVVSHDMPAQYEKFRDYLIEQHS